jgi:glycosyltransferase involved in cell wall biosynthesis
MVCGSAGDGHCGVGDYAYALAQHLALDAEVHLYFDRRHGPVRPPLPQLKTLHLHPVGGFSLAMLPFLRAQLAEAGHDVVHLQYPSKGFGASLGPLFLLQGLSGMQSRSRLVATIHEYRTAQPLRKTAIAQILPSLQGLILTNEGELPSFERSAGVRQISVIPVGNLLTSPVELEQVWGGPGLELAPPAGPGGRRPDSLFHYGLPARGKGLIRLLEALSLLRQARPAASLYLGGTFLPGEPLTEELLKAVTEYDLGNAIVKLGHLSLEQLAAEAEQCCLGVFPFDEGFSSKRSSLANLAQLDLPLVVGAGSGEEHPYYAPGQNTGAALGVLLVELLSGRLEQEWEGQVRRQRAYGRRFSFSLIAQQHLEVYHTLVKQGLS